MVDFMEFGGGGIQGLINVVEESWELKADEIEDQNYIIPKTEIRRIPPRNCLDVRQSVCIAGLHKEPIQMIKKSIASIMKEPIAIESFHVKKITDIEDGAFLVPKIILVASHCPGVKLLDEEGDTGQIDYLYDEAVNVGADIMIIYTDLPHLLYPHIRNITYHPRACDTLFPTQPLLQELASDNCFLTVTQQCKLTVMQKNLLKEWLTKPVGKEHPVYKTADYLQTLSDAEYSTSNEYSCQVWVDDEMGNSRCLPASEHHPLAEKKKRKQERKEKKSKKSSRSSKEQLPRHYRRNLSLGTLEEEDFEESMELNGYNNTEDLIKFEPTAMVDV